MSREVDAMQFILDMLTDGIVSSGTNQQIGFTLHDKIVQSQMPFVQIFTLATDNSNQTVQVPGVLTVSLEIHDVSGRKDALRDALAQLDYTLRIDQSMKGTIFKSVILARAVAERGELDRTIATATIEIQFKAGFPEPNVTNLLDFATPTGVTVIEGLFTASQRITGALGIRRDTASSTALEVIVDSGGEFPDIDVTDVQRLRLLYYIIPVYSTAFSSVALRLFDDPTLVDGYQFNPVAERFVGGHGWRHLAWDIRAPTDTFGAGWNGTTIGAVNFVFPMTFSASFSSLEYGLLFLNFGYDARDTGLNNGRGWLPGM